MLLHTNENNITNEQYFLYYKITLNIIYIR
jgi:hypothetical protein